MLNQILSEISSTFVIGKTRETLQSCVRRGLCVRQRWTWTRLDRTEANFGRIRTESDCNFF